MLLRSVTKHVKDQNWFAVFLDFFIVVAGILIAFQITNWNEARSERGDERTILVALKSDIEQSQTDLEIMIELAERGQTHTRRLVEFSDGQHDELTLGDIDESTLLGLYTIYYYTPTMITYEELVNSGRLKLISDASLRVQLQSLAGEISNLENEEASLEKMSFDTLDPFLLTHTDFRGFVAVPSATYNDVDLKWVDPFKDRRDPKQAFRSPDALNILLYRARLNSSYLSIAYIVDDLLETSEKSVDIRLAELGAN